MNAEKHSEKITRPRLREHIEFLGQRGYPCKGVTPFLPVEMFQGVHA